MIIPSYALCCETYLYCSFLNVSDKVKCFVQPNRSADPQKMNDVWKAGTFYHPLRYSATLIQTKKKRKHKNTNDSWYVWTYFSPHFMAVYYLMYVWCLFERVFFPVASYHISRHMYVSPTRCRILIVQKKTNRQAQKEFIIVSNEQWLCMCEHKIIAHTRHASPLHSWYSAMWKSSKQKCANMNG